MGVASLLFTLTSARHVAPLPSFVQLILVWVNIHAWEKKVIVCEIAHFDILCGFETGTYQICKGFAFDPI